MYSINTPSTYQPFIDISVNDSSIYYSIKKIIETELINKISNFEALKEYINKSKNVLEKISYVKDTNFTFRNGEGFLYFFTQLDQNSINEEMINWIRNLIYSFPELLDQQDNYGRTPIYFAIKNDKDKDKILELYKLGVPINKIIATHLKYGKYTSLKQFIERQL